jgi:hypothetical protein
MIELLYIIILIIAKFKNFTESHTIRILSNIIDHILKKNEITTTLNLMFIILFFRLFFLIFFLLRNNIHQRSIYFILA